MSQGLSYLTAVEIEELEDGKLLINVQAEVTAVLEDIHDGFKLECGIDLKGHNSQSTHNRKITEISRKTEMVFHPPQRKPSRKLFAVSVPRKIFTQ